MHQWRVHKEQQALLATLLPNAYEITIPKGTGLADIATIVAKSGMPVSTSAFIALAKRLRVARRLQAGVYRFSAGDTIRAVLLDMATGNVAVEKVTLLEGSTFTAIRTQLANDPRLVQTLPHMTDEAIRLTLGIPQESIEGLFMPETYFFHSGNSDLSILQRAHVQLKETLAAYWHQYGGSDVLKSPYEALILASIVEKESGSIEEQPLVASVFINRLRIGMRLQADPTVIYGLGEQFNGNLKRAHLKQPTPYNTYTQNGLTPTPIALASETAIAAVLRPTPSQYYYFVATGDGKHHFSKTLREHNNAVNRYQRRKR